MSLHTIVSDGLAGRLSHRRGAEPGPRAVASAVAQPVIDLAPRLSGMSMRILETGLAVIAIATAVVMGLGR